MDTLLQDVRFALRSLARAKAFTAVVIVVMALGIGVNVTVFAMVYGFLYRPWPLPNPDRIVVVNMVDLKRGFDRLSMSWPNYFDIRDRSKSFESIGVHWGNMAMVTLDRDPERLRAEVINSDVLPALGTHVQIGRNFTRDESVWGHNWASIIISDRIWHTRFHADPHVLGHTVRMNGRVRTIVGVMPPHFNYSETADFWIPAGYNPADSQRGGTEVPLVARLKPGLTIAQANAEVNTVFSALKRQYPELKDYGAKVTLASVDASRGPKPYIMFLLYAVIFVLLIACTNVANMMLARAAARRREIGLRLSLGASRGRIVRQLLTESVLVSLAGGALGVLVGHWGNKLWPLGVMEEMPYYISFVIDGPVLLYTTVITVLAGILFGLAPAIHAAGENFTEALREGSAQTGASARGGRLRNAFVIAEVALSLVLLVGAGLMVRSFQSLTSQGDRVQPEGVVTAQVLLPIASYPNDGQMRRFFREFVARVRSAPGVHEVAGMSALPLGNSSDTRVVMTPDTKDKRDGVPVNYGTILPGSLHLLHLDIVRGRDFTTEDDTTAAKIAIVNQALAAKLYPGKDPIGQRLRFIGEPDSIPWRRIVGVMPDIMLDVMDSKPTAYQVWVPELQETQQFMAMLVRADGDGATGASAMRQAMKALDPTLPLMDLRTMREQMNYALWVKRLLSMMVGIVAILALIIAAVGLYGVVAYSVVQRTREIGIRMALGADPANVLRMVVGQSMRLTLIGLGIGLAGAFALTRFIGGVINGVSPTDPPTFTVVAVVLALSGVFAAWVPANRATRIDPMRALRVD